MWGDKRYHSLDWELRKTFGSKGIKLSLDGGFTCPNRDGTLGTKGCIFCGQKGAGDFAAQRSLSIQAQIAQQKKLLSAKWPQGKFISYFQNFTNTYASPNHLHQLYGQALAARDMVGLAVATRPDCLPQGVLDLLECYAAKTYLWVELGLQTIKPSSAAFIRRGFDLQCLRRAVEELHARKIRVVVHLIFGLPGESNEDQLASVRFVAGLGVWGVKFHMLHIQKDTDLYSYYRETGFPLLTRDAYIDLVCDALELLPPAVVIHRLTGDGNKMLLHEPKWSLHKLRVLSGIDQELRLRGSVQGAKALNA